MITTDPTTRIKLRSGEGQYPILIHPLGDEFDLNEAKYAWLRPYLTAKDFGSLDYILRGLYN